MGELFTKGHALAPFAALSCHWVQHTESARNLNCKIVEYLQDQSRDGKSGRKIIGGRLENCAHVRLLTYEEIRCRYRGANGPDHGVCMIANRRPNTAYARSQFFTVRSVAASPD